MLIRAGTGSRQIDGTGPELERGGPVRRLQISHADRDTEDLSDLALLFGEVNQWLGALTADSV